MTEGSESPSGFKPPRRIPPPNQRALLHAVQRYADFHGIAPSRVQRWIAFMVLGGALSRVTDEEVSPQFLIKGGVALELRLRLRGRATKDFDATFRGERAKLLEALEKAFADQYEGFVFRIGGEPRAMTQSTRLEIKVEYKGRTWSSLTMDVSAHEGRDLPAERVSAISLSDFGLKGPETLPCLPLVQQVAQKLHSMTEEHEGGRQNERFRDLWDVWILRELLPPSAALRDACEETFRIRGKHSWPPQVVVPDHWAAPFGALAEQEEMAVPGAQQAAGDVQEYIRMIAEA